MALGTLADNADADGDGLTDNIEVRGFNYGGKLWYSDPNYYDTDMDAIPDAQECPQRQRESETHLSPDVPCQDTDGDGTPDLFDLDADDDGIPDKLDLSPTRQLGAANAPFSYETPFHLIINDAQADKPLVVDLQVRPQNPAHLTYVMNVLDWPDGDRQGQVQRAKGNHATFADVAPGGAARDANGDMRLIPMLEIEMNGVSIPLPLTTTLRAEAYLEGQLSGQIQMTQLPGQPVQMAFTFADARPYTVRVYSSTEACPTGRVVYTLTNVLNGETRTVNAIRLTDLANGQRLVGVSAGAEQVCANLGNVINGPYPDRMVDLPLMRSYGIAVREKTDGGLLAYAPLNVVADESGGGRVGFAARMYYRPGASWGAAHQMRMVWLVDALVDRCKRMPDSYPRTQDDWCQDPQNWILNLPQVVQTYSDEWFLTGMVAREDHGLDMAVIFEDPATDALPDVDGHLWHMTEGLNGVFLTARDEDNNGARDLPLAEIVHRFDSQHNAGVSEEQRWEIPQNALRVLPYTFSNADEVATMPMTHTRQILHTYFTAPDGSARASAPTLLFVQEQRARYANLGMDAEVVRTAQLGGTATDNQLTLSIAGDVVVRGMYQWTPYRLRAGAWEAMPLDDYFQHLASVVRPILAEDTAAYVNLTPEEREKALDIQGVLAQGYYLSVYQSLSAIVQRGNALVKASGATPDSAYKYPKMVLDTAKAVIPVIVKTLAKTFIKMALNLLKDFVIEFGGDLLQLLVKCVTPLANLIGKISSAATFFFKFLKQLRGGEVLLLLGGVVMSLVMVTVTACILLAIAAAGPTALVTVVVVLTSEPVSTFFAIMKLAFTTMGLIFAFIPFVKSVRTLLSAASNLMQVISVSGQLVGAIAAVITWAIGVILAVGLFAVQVTLMVVCGYNLFSPAVKTVLADLIAEVTYSLVMLLIGLLPIVGALVVALVSFLDALIGFICKLVPDKNPLAAKWLCGGIGGLIKTFISGAIYSYTVVMDLSDRNRLQITSFDASLADPAQGFKVGQKLTIKMGVSNRVETIKSRDADKAGITYGVLYDHLLRMDDLATRSAFVYRVQAAPDKFPVQLGQNPVPWTLLYDKDETGLARAYDSSYRAGNGPYVMTTTTVNDLAFTQAGLNIQQPIYLSEGYAVPAHECWLLDLYNYEFTAEHVQSKPHSYKPYANANVCSSKLRAASTTLT